MARTSLLLARVALGLGQSNLLPSLKYSGLERAPERAKRSGILPMTISIIARCSKLSCVWNKATPVKNSTRIQPREKASQGYDQPSPDKRKKNVNVLLNSRGSVLTKDNFWCSVMASTNNCRVILFLESSTAEVDKTYFRAIQYPFRPHRSPALHSDENPYKQIAYEANDAHTLPAMR